MRTRGIVIFLGWLTMAGLTSTGAFAAPLPQESEKPSETVPAKHEKKADAKPLDKERTESIRSERNASEGSTTTSSRHGFAKLGEDFLLDQKQIWTSPARLRFSDTEWLVPIGGLTAGLFVTDSSFSRHLSQNPSTISHYKTLSNGGVAALIGGAGGMWLLGHASHNEHWKETGFLAGEAAFNSLVAVESMKYSLRRERPFQGDGSGAFFQSHGTSFPSEHAAAAWSVAGVIAHEYPGPFTKILVYGLASMVDISRVRSRQHFPSDVVVGSILGNLVAQNIYSRHHDPELGGGEWRSLSRIFRADGTLSQANQGSPYVPLDSWIYPAFDRLAAMGLIDSEFAGMRPWTRFVCAQMVSEVQDRADESEPIASDLVRELEKEFRPELGEGGDQGLVTARLESAYFRSEYISGMPLNDGYHFAQTQINDFGRPYSQGWNTVTGFSSYVTSGRWVGYVRGELQTAPSVQALPLAARQSAASADVLPVAPGAPSPSLQQSRLLDAYVGLTFANWQVSFGRQSLEWGPGDGGALMFSNNAGPIDMFRVNRVAPLSLPLLSRFLGPMRVEFFLGRLSGQHFVGNGAGADGSFIAPLASQPFIQGERLTFKPTRNFEFGFSHTTLMGGPGIPLTFETFKDALFHRGSTLLNGDGRSGMDWSYRLPLMRKWVTFYGDAFTEDEYSPIAYWDRSAIRGGLFVSHFPKLRRLDLRVEGVYTDVPAGGKIGGGYFYWNALYRNGYTNDGFLIGNWVGRDGQGAQAWTNYWFSAKNRIQFSFRHQKVSPQFVTDGGTLTDAGVRGDYWFHSGLGLSASVQYERWLFPVIQPGPERNVSASVQIQFQPQELFRPSLHRDAQSTTGEGAQP